MDKPLYIPIDTSIRNPVDCTELVKRGDTLLLKIKVFTKAELTDLTGESIDIILKKSDGARIEREIDTSNISNGIIYVKAPQQSTLVEGKVHGELQIYTDGTLSSTNTFTYTVDASLADDILIASQDDIQVLADLRNLISNGQVTIEKYKDSILAIGNSIEAIQALASIKSYLELRLPALESANAEAVVNIQNEITANDEATKNIRDLTALNNTADLLNTDLEANILTGNTLNNDLKGNITGGAKLKSDLEADFITGDKLKNGLENDFITGDKLKSDLDAENVRAEANREALAALGDVTDLAKTVQETKTEINNARGGKANLDERLDEIDTSLLESVQKIDDLSKSVPTADEKTAWNNKVDKSDYLLNIIYKEVDNSSTAAAYTVTLNPVITNYNQIREITILPNVDCAAGATLNICGLGPYTIMNGSTAVKAGDMKSNIPYKLVRVGTSFFLNKGGGSAQSSLGNFDAFYTKLNSTPIMMNWLYKGKAITSALDRAKAVAVNGKIYVTGGGNATLGQTMLIFDIATNTWSVGPSIPVPFWIHAMTYYDGRIYLFGGYNGSVGVTNAYAFNISTNTWSAIRSLPVGRYSLTAQPYSGKIFIACGHTGSARSNQFDIYDIATDTYTAGTVYPIGIEYPGSVQYDKFMEILGGNNGNPLSNIYRIDLSTGGIGSWISMPAMPTTKTAPACQYYKGFVFAIGGFNANVLTTNEYRSVANGLWYTGPSALTSRQFPVSALNDREIFVLGYDATNGLTTTDVLVINTEA